MISAIKNYFTKRKYRIVSLAMDDVLTEKGTYLAFDERHEIERSVMTVMFWPSYRIAKQNLEIRVMNAEKNKQKDKEERRKQIASDMYNAAKKRCKEWDHVNHRYNTDKVKDKVVELIEMLGIGDADINMDVLLTVSDVALYVIFGNVSHHYSENDCIKDLDKLADMRENIVNIAEDILGVKEKKKLSDYAEERDKQEFTGRSSSPLG